MNKKFAVFVDGENISWRVYEDVISAVEICGEIIEKRIYGDWSEPNMKNWKKELDKNPAIPIQVFRNGKNATDFHIMMDAIEIATLNKEINAFCIASSDVDYKYLSQRLRSHGKYVLGVGENKSSDKWCESCDYFVKLGVQSNDEDKVYEEPVIRHENLTFEEALEYGFLHLKRKDGWVFVTEFCETIKKGCPDFFWELGRRPLEVLKKYEQETGKIEIDELTRGAFRIREKTKTVLISVPALGVIDQLNNDDGFGFIKCLDKKYYFKREDIEDGDLTLENGCEVQFTITKYPESGGIIPREKNGRAFNVRRKCFQNDTENLLA
jgi:cold shock CspA family protein